MKATPQNERTRDETVVAKVSGLIAAAPIAGSLALLIFVLSLPRVPQSPGFWLSTALVACVGFALVWQYWRRPTGAMFAALIGGLVISGAALRSTFLGRDHDLSFWAVAQHLALTFAIVFALLLLFRRRVHTSLSRRDERLTRRCS